MARQNDSKVRKDHLRRLTGLPLAASLDRPSGAHRATALFAHCFTCSKDIFAASRIAGELTKLGFAVLRFDFTGLGMSGGEFANTNFSSNVQDLLAAAACLRGLGLAADVLIGHSLGGAAVLAAAGDIPEAKAVVTICAPAEAGHVVKNFGAHLDEIQTKGEATVTLAGRPFAIKRQFLDDLAASSFHHRIAEMRKALLVFHAPTDTVVGIDNAAMIFAAARHPKSFVALHGADHLLSKREDAAYVASVLSAWVSRYIDHDGRHETPVAPEGFVSVEQTGDGKFQQLAVAGGHRLLVDEPADVGGTNTGPSPYDLLAIALGACTSMTMRLYAEHKGIPLGPFAVLVQHAKRHMEDCQSCEHGKPARIDHFDRVLSLPGDLPEETRRQLLAIADRCPVHQTLQKGASIATRTEPLPEPKPA
jgi:uncharacterized OsmC-like protein/pimeloyl-ACP methyl ester carboxylesterase